MLLHIESLSLSPVCVCAVHSRTWFALDWHTGKSGGPKKVTKTFIYLVIGPHPPKLF